MQLSLDQTVKSLQLELRELGVCKPDILFLMATGTQHLVDHLERAQETALGTLAQTPATWEGTSLHSGLLGDLNVWAMDDLSGDPSLSHGLEPAWVDALAIWLASKAGAALCVHTSAGCALAPAAGPGFALLSDHINLSGSSPLTGLGPSELGPLFPDQSQVHHLGLRHAAMTHGTDLGLAIVEATAACTSGPSIETPAERRMLAKLGAEVSVQSLAAPLIACAHTGLACLAMVSVSGAEPGDADLELLVQQATHAGPQLNRWLLALLPDFRQAIDALRAEQLI